ncbi:MAG TPA: dTDP-4-dehydrorhamnose reductase [Thermoanaerobaculia bacterium]|nr:dTDP-4-dehydrorhamnose reductase [Thermoanaerobaculia bacterium]
MSGLLVLGAGGMLGRAVAEAATAAGLPCSAPDRAELDLLDTAAVARRLDAERPGAVVNCAAFTDVDGCEARVEHALETNGHAVGRLARVVASFGSNLLQVSTDYVFPGDARAPYGEDAETAPRSVYGESKRLGERLALESGASIVVRTSWLFGPGGRNFVDTILRRAETGGSLRVVDDQVGCPTYAPYLARALVDLAVAAIGERQPRPPSLLHYRNREPVSWYGFARAALAEWELDVPIEPVTAAELSRPAPRPAYSVLAVGRFEAWAERRVEDWRDALRDYRVRREAAA